MIQPTWQLSADPAIYIYNNFLTPEECEFFINKSIPRLNRSTVINNTTGESVLSDNRDAYTMFYNRAEDYAIRGLEQLVAETTGFPVENQENLQFCKYPEGGYYEAHYDYFMPDVAGSAVHLAKGGQRQATMLIFLNTVEKGGETGFPELGIKVDAIQGRALFWYNTFNDLTPDPRTKHSGEPVLKGEKYILTKWIHPELYPNIIAPCGENTQQSPQRASLLEY